MRRAKKEKPDIRRKYTLSEKQLQKIKNEVEEEAVSLTAQLYLAALAEMGWNEDQIVALFETVSRYVNYVDDHVVAMRDVRRIIKEHTGMEIKGSW